MSGPEPTVDEQREALAEAFDREIDPLAKHGATFEATGVDPFDLFADDVLDGMDLADTTRMDWAAAIEQWREHMADAGRHPACPNEGHVRAFAEYLLEERGNKTDTVKKKLHRLNTAFEYWQNDPAFPHPVDYNPFRAALSKLSLPAPEVKEPPRVPIDDLAEHVRGIPHVRDRAIVVLQLKLGLRAGEVCNIELRDVNLANAELQRFYPELGSHASVERHRNAVYIPSRDERDGNKSVRPRVLPLDEEVRRVLIRWLLIRPDVRGPWVFLTKEMHTQIRNDDVGGIWREYFRPEYAETEQHRRITSHFGRHRFTTWWRTEQDANRELVKYMRGDVTRQGSLDDRGAIDEYIHTYSEDVEDLYRERIFRLNV